jgi:hypothetical protein
MTALAAALTVVRMFAIWPMMPRGSRLRERMNAIRTNRGEDAFGRRLRRHRSMLLRPRVLWYWKYASAAEVREAGAMSRSLRLVMPSFCMTR